MPTDSDSRKLERIESALSNLEISADSVNLNTDGLEAKLDTANGILTTLSADTALLKADVADGVGVGSLPAISGTVTVAGSITALPVTGGLNDYSGSVTSADTSYDVVGTNASRRYALVQNISDTGMWLGIGTAATTTSGIFLASNSGIVWESGYIPTPTLSILCTTSGKRFVVKEI
jgi:hypothetical protein